MKGTAVIQQFEYKELGVFRGHSSAHIRRSAFTITVFTFHRFRLQSLSCSTRRGAGCRAGGGVPNECRTGVDGRGGCARELHEDDGTGRNVDQRTRDAGRIGSGGGDRQCLRGLESGRRRSDLHVD